MRLLKAELWKLTGNRMLISFTVWIFPVGIGAFLAIAITLSFLLEGPARAMALTSSGTWTADAAAIWRAISSFPADIFGSLLPLSFMAVGYAGEYAWGTYRNVLPRAHRLAIMAAKAAALVLVLTASFLLSSALTVIGFAILRLRVGLGYGPPVSGQALADFGISYLTEALIGIAGLLVLTGFAALAAVLTRSILGGLLASFGLSVLEPMSLAVLVVAGRVFDWPGAVDLYRFTPSYNLDNARTWLLEGHAFQSPLAEIGRAPELAASLGLILGWILLLHGLAAWLFNRQDIVE